jgi:hypothetical protein
MVTALADNRVRDRVNAPDTECLQGSTREKLASGHFNSKPHKVCQPLHWFTVFGGSCERVEVLGIMMTERRREPLAESQSKLSVSGWTGFRV